MTRVDFYILSDAGANARERFACRLAEKAYDGDYRALVLTDNDEQTERLDSLLWTFRQGSFIPHAALTARSDEPIGIGASEAGDDAVLINLTERLPESWQRRTRIVEVVDSREAVLRASRQRYKSYKMSGCTPQTHQIDKG